MPVAVWSKLQVCSHLITGIMSFDSTDGMDVCLLFVVCCVGSSFCDEPYQMCVCDLENLLRGEIGPIWPVAPRKSTSNIWHCMKFVFSFSLIEITNKLMKTVA
jgi:hypothetical protein